MNFVRNASWFGVVRGSLGFLAVAAVLALTSPGVQIARAGDEVATPSGAGLVTVDPALVQAQTASASKTGPSCASPGTRPTLNDAMVEHQTRRMMQEIARQAAAAQPGQAPGEQGIVLNGRGHNYHPTRIR